MNAVPTDSVYVQHGNAAGDAGLLSLQMIKEADTEIVPRTPQVRNHKTDSAQKITAFAVDVMLGSNQQPKPYKDSRSRHGDLALR